jgi:hypothetical protein
MEHPNVELLMVLYWMLPKIPTYTFINFQEIFPPILLFSPIFLLVFEEISHLYFYSDSSSIRNSRVLTFINRCVIFQRYWNLAMDIATLVATTARRCALACVRQSTSQCIVTRITRTFFLFFNQFCFQQKNSLHLFWH